MELIGAYRSNDDAGQVTVLLEEHVIPYVKKDTQRGSVRGYVSSGDYQRALGLLDSKRYRSAPRSAAGK